MKKINLEKLSNRELRALVRKVYQGAPGEPVDQVHADVSEIFAEAAMLRSMSGIDFICKGGVK